MYITRTCIKVKRKQLNLCQCYMHSFRIFILWGNEKRKMWYFTSKKTSFKFLRWLINQNKTSKEITSYQLTPNLNVNVTFMYFALNWKCLFFLASYTNRFELCYIYIESFTRVCHPHYTNQGLPQHVILTQPSFAPLGCQSCVQAVNITEKDF